MVVQEDTTTTTTTKDEVITVNSGDDDIVENGYVNVNANIKSDHVVESNPLQNTNEKVIDIAIVLYMYVFCILV